MVGRDSRMPDVRVGLATGSVVMRLGDVFGPPVNMASRLTAVARRNRIIIDAATATLLPGGPVRDPAAPRTPGARLRHRGAGGRAPALTVGRPDGRPGPEGRIFLLNSPPRPPMPSYLCPVFEVQDVRLDPETRRTWRGVEEILLSRKEFDLVHALIRRAGQIVTRDELMREVWNTTFWTSSKTIDVHLGWVRRKLGDDSRRPRLITTIRGQGLRFETQDMTR